MTPKVVQPWVSPGVDVLGQLPVSKSTVCKLLRFIYKDDVYWLEKSSHRKKKKDNFKNQLSYEILFFKSSKFFILTPNPVYAYIKYMICKQIVR